FPVDARLRQRAVLIVEAARYVGAQDAALDREVAEPEFLEDRIAHGWGSSDDARSQTALSRAVVQSVAGQWLQLAAMKVMSSSGSRLRAASSSRSVSAPSGRLPQ